MAINIIEFKARLVDIEKAEALLKSLHPHFKGEDVQTDTYFNVSTGRLKLREGAIENALIWYDRKERAGSKHSHVLLHQHKRDDALKEILVKLHGIKTVVQKTRRIYFIDNIKFHFDEVEGLGKFIEVEAIDESGHIGTEKLQAQCEHYAKLFGVKAEEYIAASYSDMLLEQKATPHFPTLYTQRLLLREIRPGDIERVFKGLSDEAVIKHFGVSFKTLDATQEQMKWYADMLSNDSGRCWAICSHDDNIFYGVCTLNFWKKEHHNAETGYWIFPEFWGKGIVPEAMRSILQYGFKEMHLHRIAAEVEDDNDASIKVLEKLGFLKEGTRRHCEIKDGRFINLHMYALLNETPTAG